MEWRRGLVKESRPTQVRSTQVRPIQVQPAQNRNMNQLELGVAELREDLREAVAMLHELRVIGVETAVGLEETRQDVRFGIESTNRTRDSLSQQLTRVGREMRAAAHDAMERSSRNPWEMLWVWWQMVWQFTVLAWQFSWYVTRSMLAVFNVHPFLLCCCSLGCIALEGCTLVMITDVGMSLATGGFSHYYGLHYQLFDALVYGSKSVLISICTRLINTTTTYFSPYAGTLVDAFGISPQAMWAWHQRALGSLSSFVGGIVEERVRATVEPIVTSVANIPEAMYNNSIGLVDVSSLGVPQIVTNTASGISGLAVGAASGLSSAASSAATGVSGLASSAATGVSGLASSAATGVSGLASSAATGARRWVGLGGNPEPFSHIHLLQGRDLEMFNDSALGKYLKILHKKLNRAFINKYGNNGTVLDKKAEELLEFMNHTSILMLDSIHYIAEKMLLYESIPVDKKLAVALIKSAFDVSLNDRQISGRRINGTRINRRRSGKRLSVKRITWNK
jgi:hypothetical protein